MVVVGAGVIGVEYASMFAALGTKVTIVEKRETMLEFCDPEIVEAPRFHLRDLAVTFRFGEEVTAVDVGSVGTVTTLASGKQIPAETVMYSAGREGQTDDLDLANAGLEADSRGRIFVDDQFRTKVDHIYAVGDVLRGLQGRHAGRAQQNPGAQPVPPLAGRDLAAIVEVWCRGITGAARLRPRKQLRDVLIERRRVGQLLPASAAIETADHPDDRRTADPRRTAGAVDQPGAWQRRVTVGGDPGAGLAADRRAAHTGGVRHDADLAAAGRCVAQRQPGAGLGFDRTAGGPAHPGNRIVGVWISPATQRGSR